MLPDRVSNPGPLTYESGALPIALRGPAGMIGTNYDRTSNIRRLFPQHFWASRQRYSCIRAYMCMPS